MSIRSIFSKRSASPGSAAAGSAKAARSTASLLRPTANILGRAARVLAVAWTALAAGSRMIPLGDNGALLQALTARLYGGLGGTAPDRPVDERHL
jgi:hypothetical protein